jgi:zinc/manganese transport system permease protein
VIAFNATITLSLLAVIYRPLVIECVDPVFLRTVSRAGAPAHLAFLALVVINLVNGFHALGTLLGVGLMVLPAAIARFWSRDITGMMMIAVVSAMLSGYAGLVLSFHSKVPSAWKPLTRLTTISARNARCAGAPARLTVRRNNGSTHSITSGR